MSPEYPISTPFFQTDNSITISSPILYQCIKKTSISRIFITEFSPKSAAATHVISIETANNTSSQQKERKEEKIEKLFIMDLRRDVINHFIVPSGLSLELSRQSRLIPKGNALKVELSFFLGA